MFLVPTSAPGFSLVAGAHAERRADEHHVLRRRARSVTTPRVGAGGPGLGDRQPGARVRAGRRVRRAAAPAGAGFGAVGTRGRTRRRPAAAAPARPGGRGDRGLAAARRAGDVDRGPRPWRARWKAPWRRCTPPRRSSHGTGELLDADRRRRPPGRLPGRRPRASCSTCYREAQISTLYGGTSEVLRGVIAEQRARPAAQPATLTTPSTETETHLDGSTAVRRTGWPSSPVADEVWAGRTRGCWPPAVRTWSSTTSTARTTTGSPQPAPPRPRSPTPGRLGGRPRRIDRRTVGRARGRRHGAATRSAGWTSSSTTPASSGTARSAR